MDDDISLGQPSQELHSYAGLSHCRLFPFFFFYMILFPEGIFFILSFRFPCSEEIDYS